MFLCASQLAPTAPSELRWSARFPCPSAHVGKAQGATYTWRHRFAAVSRQDPPLAGQRMSPGAHARVIFMRFPRVCRITAIALLHSTSVRCAKCQTHPVARRHHEPVRYIAAVQNNVTASRRVQLTGCRSKDEYSDLNASCAPRSTLLRRGRPTKNNRHGTHKTSKPPSPNETRLHSVCCRAPWQEGQTGKKRRKATLGAHRRHRTPLARECAHPCDGAGARRLLLHAVLAGAVRSEPWRQLQQDLATGGAVDPQPENPQTEKR